EAEDRLERRRLAGAIGTDQADDAAGVDLEVDRIERNGVAVALAQSAGLHDGVHLPSSWRGALSSSCRSSPSRARRACSAGHSSRRKRSRSDSSSASRAPSLTYMPSPLLFSTRFSSTSSW